MTIKMYRFGTEALVFARFSISHFVNNAFTSHCLNGNKQGRYGVETGCIMKISRLILAPLAALAFAGSANASTVVVGGCDSVTDGDAMGCLFTGNINENTNPTNVNSYLYAQAGYNAWASSTGNPAITLNFLTASDAGNFGSFGSITGGTGSSGTFNLPGYNIAFYAVKAGDHFTLYENVGLGSTGMWATADGKDLSHIAFFTTAVPAVPEPGTWAMMLFGFGAMGVTMRSKRRRPGTLQIA